MLARLALLLLLVSGIPGCVVYEYEHEFWLNTDGSGTVYVTGRPELWTAFKGLPTGDDANANRQAAQALFERSGLKVKRVTVTHRGGRAYLFVSATFDHVNALSATPAFPDLKISLSPQGADQLRLAGQWVPLAGAAARAPGLQTDGQMAVRFHLPSKVYSHDNAMAGVERGNIVGWREAVASAAGGQPLAFGALIDRRSILFSTVSLFATAILLGLSVLGICFWMVVRKGRQLNAAA